MSKHYYYQDGASAYEIPKKGKAGERGEMKAPNINDARELGLFPSVTTIIGDTQRKEALERWGLWKYGRTAFAHLPSCPTPLRGEPDSSWTSTMQANFNWWHNLVKDKAFTSEAADLGTQIHLIVESVTKDEELPDVEMEIDPDMLVAFSELWNSLKLTVVETEFNVAHPLGYGGRGDLWAIDADQRDVILDYKTRDTKEGKPLDFYPELPKQLVAYAKGIEQTNGIDLHRPRLISLVLSRTEPSRVEMKEWPEENYEGYWSSFIGLMHNWCADNKYWPGGEFNFDLRMEE